MPNPNPDTSGLKPWQPGESGNPKGRPSAGATLRDWVNVMADWTPVAIQAVVDDVDAPVAKRAAARLWLDASSDERNAAGSPIAGAEFDRIMDRTIGRPKQSVELTNDGAPRTDAERVAAADSILADLLATMGAKPPAAAH